MYSAKWKKSESKGCILYYFIYIHSGKHKTLALENWLPGVKGGRGYHKMTTWGNLWGWWKFSVSWLCGSYMTLHLSKFIELNTSERSMISNKVWINKLPFLYSVIQEKFPRWFQYAIKVKNHSPRQWFSHTCVYIDPLGLPFLPRLLKRSPGSPSTPVGH